MKDNSRKRLISVASSNADEYQEGITQHKIGRRLTCILNVTLKMNFFLETSGRGHGTRIRSQHSDKETRPQKGGQELKQRVRGRRGSKQSAISVKRGTGDFQHKRRLSLPKIQLENQGGRGGEKEVGWHSNQVKGGGGTERRKNKRGYVEHRKT